MSGKLIVSSSPHVGSKLTTQTIMLHVIIALAFPLVAGVVLYGLYSLLVVLLSVIAAVLAEMLFNLIRKKPQTVSDLSAVVTGMILGLNLPPTIPLYVPVVGSIFAIMIVKMLFGGLGKNFANPAATARVSATFSPAKKISARTSLPAAGMPNCTPKETFPLRRASQRTFSMYVLPKNSSHTGCHIPLQRV